MFSPNVVKFSHCICPSTSTKTNALCSVHITVSEGNTTEASVDNIVAIYVAVWWQ